ncbi:MAG: hypothetical protein SVR94_05890 [Pseudomonadota bacterium]|nr:hypothetical protein [Pseudomonadota bacterium]
MSVIDSTHTLRLRLLWLSLGWGLVLIVIRLSLMPPTPATQSLFSIPYGDKLAHFLIYFLLMGWFMQIYHTARQRLSYMIGFITLGIILELLQDTGGVRHGDWRDAIANSVGVLCAWQLTKKRFADLLLTLEQFAKVQ